MNFFKSVKNFFGINSEISKSIEVEPKIKRVRAKSKRITKNGLVQKHLIEKGTITSWEAIDLYGATRLSAIIFNLKNDGMHIESQKLISSDRNGNVCNYVKYKYINGAY